jgi:hypothetical protein
MSVWAYIPALASASMNVFWALNGQNGFRCRATYLGGGVTQWTAQYYYTGSNFTSIQTTTGILVNKWYNLTNTMSSSGVHTFYVNGVFIGTDSSAGSAIVGQNINGVTIGSGQQNNQFVGYVQDLRFYNTALSAPQILGIYQSQGIPPRLTLTSNVAQPSLLFSLNGTTNDSVLGIQGAVTGTTQYVNGNYGQAFNFLNLQGSAAVNYITATQSAVTFSNTAGFSVSFWVNPTPALTATQYWFGIFNGSSTEILRGSVTTSGILVFFGATGASYPTNRIPIPSLQWSHVAFVINTTTISLYVNGVYQSGSSGSYTSTGLSSFTGPINLGTSQAGSSLGLTGYMQDFRIYNTALSAQQIQGIYQSQGIPPMLTLKPSTANLPSPTLAFPFNGSNVESITGLTPIAQYPITGNSALQGSAAYVKTAPNITTSALYCTGPYATSSNCMNLGTSTPAKFDYNASNLFCEFWWYTSNVNTGNLNTPISLGVINTTETSYRIQVGLGTGFGLNFSTSVSNTTSLSASTWYHFAFSVDSTNKVIYPFVNGFGGVSSSYAGTLSYNSAHTLVIGYSNALSTAFYYDQYIQDMRIVQGGIVPVTNFTPASPSFQYVLPSYVTGTGGTVFTLQSQFVNYTNGLLSGQAINFLSNASVLPATSNVSYTISPSLSTTSLTISAWIKPTTVAASPGQNMALASYGQNSDGDVRWGCNRVSASTFNIYLLYNFATGTWIGSTTVNFTIGTWVHVAMTISGGPAVSNVVTNYVNGVFYESKTSATRDNTNNLGRLTVGSFCSGAYNSQFNGLVQDVRMYNSALTSTQIQTIYQSGGNLYGGNLVQPTYLWPFTGTTTDIITNKAPSSANINTSYTTTLPITWPYYDTINQKYGRASITCNGNSGNTLYYNNLSVLTAGSTVTAWVKVLGYVSSVYAIFNIYPTGQNGLYIWPDSVGRLNWTLYVGGPSGGTFVSAPTSPGNVLNVWSHVAVSFSSTSAAMYLNGNQFTTLTYSTLLTNAANTWTNLSLGSWQYLGKEGSPCEISDFRIYNTALSTSQIQGIYLSGGAPPSAVLTSG